MTTQSIAKVAGSAVVSGALLLAGTGMAFAQTTYTTGTTDPNAATMTTGTTNTTGTTGAVDPSATTGTAATGTTGTTGTVTPGVPNTGAGGDAAANVAVLGVSALVVAGGALYLARRKYALS